MLTKYAEAGSGVIEAYVPSNAGPGRLARVRRQAHRAAFNYTPRRGFIYVRSRAISSRTNDNYDSFPAEEIKKAYRTFIGKPVFVNHHNSDPKRARGVIIDAALHEDTNPDGTEDTWAEVLMEVDAVRFPVLAREVLKGNIARTSMGTDVAYSVCTACGNKAVTPVDYCQHIPRLKGMKVHRTLASGAKEEVLVAEVCYGLGFFENSLLVEDPADPTAFVLGIENGDDALDKAAAKEIIDEAETITREAADWGPAFDGEKGQFEIVLTEDGKGSEVVGIEANREDAEDKKQHVQDLHPGAHVEIKPVEQKQAHTASSIYFLKEYFEDGSPDMVDELGGPPSEDLEIIQRRKEQREQQDRESGRYRPDKWRIIQVTPRASHQTTAARHLAYGETKAPPQVDTLRVENCPVCGDDEGFDGERCKVCGYMQPPDQFRDPDLDKAKQMDLRQDQADAQGLDQNGVGADGPIDATAPGPADSGQSLECTNCGEVFSAEGEAAPGPGVDDDEDPQTPPQAEDQQPDPTKDGDGPKAGEHPEHDPLADPKDDDEDPFADLDDEDDPEDPDAKRKRDETARTEDAQGTGRVISEPGKQPGTPGEPGDPLAKGENPDDPNDPNDPLADLDAEIAPNMTCPVCGLGTLVPAAQRPVEDKEPPLNEVGQQATTSRRKRVGTMNQPNPAQERRNAIVEAVRGQQRTIETQARQIAAHRNDIRTLGEALATLAVAAGVGNHPKFAGIVRAAGLRQAADTNNSPEGAPSTSTEEARKPDATDNVENVGTVPGKANDGVTPKGVTDVQGTDVVSNPPVLDNLQDVTAPVSGTDAVVPAAATGTGDVRVTAPSKDSFDSTGPSWSGSPQSVNRSAARGTDQERFVSSMRLARLQIAAQVVPEGTEDLALAQAIASTERPLGEIVAQIEALSSVAPRQSAPVPTTAQRRRLVPTRQASQALPGGQPSMTTESAIPAPAGRDGDDEWMVGSID